MIIKEFCAENLTDLHRLTSPAISRVELCDNLAVGGTTPSYGVIKEAAQLLHDKGISLATMIRPRGGDFVYTDIELRIMEEDILRAVELGSDALVFGCLTADNRIDTEAIEQLLPACQGVDMVFHMAFDQVPMAEQAAAIDQLIELGFTRLLLHGSAERGNILDNADHIKSLMAQADGKLEFLLGGGVNLANYEEVLAATGAKQVHGTGLI